MTSRTLSAEERARRIQLLIFDVDGVLTDGGIWIFPAPGGDTAGHATAQRTDEHKDKGGFAISSQQHGGSQGLQRP